MCFLLSTILANYNPSTQCILMKSVAFALVLALACAGASEEELQASSRHEIVAGTFANPIDHTNHFNQATFKQRYWYTLSVWKYRGPILLWICGAEAGGFPKDDAFIMTLAKDFSAVVVALEHRYYGASLPFIEFTMDSLRYLNPTQALADIACFIPFFRNKLDDQAKGPLKVFAIGGGYGGALSAWARYKYPHLVDGALSSSGMVNTILDFYMFDQQVKKSILKNGEQCVKNIQHLLDEVQEMWNKNAWSIKNAYRAPYVEWDDFMFFFSDIFAQAVQWSYRTKMCAFLKSIMNDEQRHHKLSLFAEEHKITPNFYSFEYIRITQTDPINNYRQWTYQFCSSLGYFNTISHDDSPLRFKDMNVSYWKRYCQKSFDVTLFPDTFHTNSLYSGVRIEEAGSKIIFTNGVEDPWRWAGVQP
eukprot:TRINITY_DN7040_c0_g2_i5.p2 TRINITY_DN7040_c0_g2~~TRINITY_DN7040_c0_g2_i5.p2  ORF type:complete len:419 (-),score=91.92 TRINITY_DN7040_c0_g2_i5:242-1498(-)